MREHQIEAATDKAHAIVRMWLENNDDIPLNEQRDRLVEDIRDAILTRPQHYIDFATAEEAQSASTILAAHQTEGEAQRLRVLKEILVAASNPGRYMGADIRSWLRDEIAEAEAALRDRPSGCVLCDAEQPMAEDGNYHDMGGGVRQKCTRLRDRPVEGQPLVGVKHRVVNGHVLKDCKCGKSSCPVCEWGAGICVNCNAAEVELERPCKSPEAATSAANRASGELRELAQRWRGFRGGPFFANELDAALATESEPPQPSIEQ